jgi:hypothetical protein
MVDIFSIFIVVIAIGLFGGLLYLIYLPFKSRLRKSRKLTDKLNRQINRTFIISLCLVGVVLYCFKDYRTSSKDRLEKISDIKLPTDFKVLKDEYRDFAPMPHFQILYEIKFDDKSSKEIVKSITTSPFYNFKIKAGDDLFDTSFIQVENEKVIWFKTINGYAFRRTGNGNIYYNITFDTLTNILSYEESSD